jgi:hypothetical protein
VRTILKSSLVVHHLSQFGIEVIVFLNPIHQVIFVGVKFNGIVSFIIIKEDVRSLKQIIHVVDFSFFSSRLKEDGTFSVQFPHRIGLNRLSTAIAKVRRINAIAISIDNRKRFLQVTILMTGRTGSVVRRSEVLFQQVQVALVIVGQKIVTILHVAKVTGFDHIPTGA